MTHPAASFTAAADAAAAADAVGISRRDRMHLAVLLILSAEDTSLFALDSAQ